jgi:hypothetical protein
VAQARGGEARHGFIAGHVMVTMFRARQGNRVAVWSMVRRDDVGWEGRRRAAADGPMEDGGAGVGERGKAAWH